MLIVPDKGPHRQRRRRRSRLGTGERARRREILPAQIRPRSNHDRFTLVIARRAS